jgi:hypothetical protein
MLLVPRAVVGRPLYPPEPTFLGPTGITAPFQPIGAMLVQSEVGDWLLNLASGADLVDPIECFHAV